MISFKLSERKNPLDSEAQTKYYATAVSNGTLSLKDLAKQIAMLSTVSRTDCVAVLTGLLEVVPLELLKGNIIRLGDLGSLRVTLSSEGAESEEDFSSSLIKNANVRFLPGQELKQEMLKAEYSKIK